jgi:hypothetical protein
MRAELRVRCPTLTLAVWVAPGIDERRRFALRLELANAAERALGGQAVDLVVLDDASPLLRQRAWRDGEFADRPRPAHARAGRGAGERQGRRGVERSLQLEVERALQVSIQICIDIGAHLVSKLGLKPAEDYQGVFASLGRL